MLGGNHTKAQQSEMRRRIWAYLGTAEILFSFQVGLRCMINVDEFLLNLPRNIDDDLSFHEQIQTLPPAVDSSVPTPVSFIISKATLAAHFGKMLEEMSQIEEVPYDRVLEIDRNLRKVYDEVPEYYKLQTHTTQHATSVALITARFMLASLHHKSICVFHSRFLATARRDPRYAYCRRSCLESVMRLLSYQAIQHEHSLISKGHQNLNRYQTSITTHDFLLGAALLSVELSLDDKVSHFEHQSDCGPSRNEMIAALERSLKIWNDLRDWSPEAYKAADVLTMLLRKFRKQNKDYDDGTAANKPVFGLSREPASGLGDQFSRVKSWSPLNWSFPPPLQYRDQLMAYERQHSTPLSGHKSVALAGETNTRNATLTDGTIQSMTGVAEATGTECPIMQTSDLGAPAAQDPWLGQSFNLPHLTTTDNSHGGLNEQHWQHADLVSNGVAFRELQSRTNCVQRTYGMSVWTYRTSATLCQLYSL